MEILFKKGQDMSHATGLKFRVLGFSFVLCSLFGGTTRAQEGSAPSNTYRTVQTWNAQLPDGTKIGFTNGIDIAPNGNVMIMTQCGVDDCASEIDASGKVLKSFGKGLFVEPHGIFVDKSGNVWVTDAAAAVVHEGETRDPKKGYQVFKFSPEGNVLLTLGKAGVKGEGPDTFGAPADVVVAPNGDIFVSDGHGGCDCPNNRIVKFTKDGKFIKTWGKTGSDPGDFKSSPHALMFDSSGRLFVGDTGNDRIQIFTQDGKFITEWKQFGRPGGIFIDKDDTLYVADTLSKSIRIGSAKTGKVTAVIPDPDGGSTGGVEGVVVDHKGNVYSTASNPKQMKRYEKQ